MVLGLFFTRGVSLKLWVETGLYDREKLIYEEHLKLGNLKKVYWFTYGKDDAELSKKLKKENRLHPDIEVYRMPSIFSIPKIGSWIYSFVLIFVHRNKLKECDILKTNQMDGSWSAVYAKKLYGKPLIVRTGWTFTQLLKSKKGSFVKIKLYELIERYAYKHANKKVVSSKNNKEYLEKSYQLRDVEVLPNYVDNTRFYNKNLKRYKNRFIFVGRLNEEKNLFNLIEAISKTEYELDIYGQGELKKELKDFALKLGAKVNFRGTVSNAELVNIYNSYYYYILPSYFEGMPKTLLEAMACGCVCVGTDVNGISEVIKDNYNGFLAKNTSTESILQAIKKAITSSSDEIVANGIRKIEKDFSLKSITEKENVIFKELTNAK